MTNPRENQLPQVTIRDIEHLAWATRKKVVDEEPVIVTKFTLEAEATGEQIKTLHSLLKSGGALSVSFTSPQLMMDFELRKIEQEKDGKDSRE